MVMLLSLMPGCSSNQGSSGKTSGTDSSTNESTEKTSGESVFNETGYPIVNETVTYTMLNPTSAGEDWSNLRLFKVMEEVTNVRFKFSNTPASDYETRQNLLLASGDLPDVFWNYLGNSNIQKYGVDGGMLFDFSSLIDKYMPNMMAMVEKYPLALVAVTEMNGGIYTFPKVSMTATETGETLFVRTDFLKKAGIEGIPKTIEEFYDMLKTLKEFGFSDEFVPLLPSNMNNLEVYLFPSFGPGVDPYFADAGDGKTVVYNAISEQYRRYIEFMNKLYTEGLLEQEIYSMDSAAITAKIKANNAAVMTVGTSLTLANFESGTYDVVLIPPMTSQYTDTRKIRGLPYEKIGGISISTTCKNPEVLLRYFDIWYSEEDVVVEGLNGISTKFGIYGVDWEYLDENKMYYRRIVPENTDLTEEEWRISNVAPASQPPGYAIMTAIASGNPAQEMKGYQCVNYLMPYWVDRFPASFLKFNNDENEVIANKLTDIETYVNTMKAKFITGVEPLENWDKFVSTVESMGIKDVLSVYQAAYDRLNEIKKKITK